MSEVSKDKVEPVIVATSQPIRLRDSRYRDSLGCCNSAYKKPDAPVDPQENDH